MQTPSIKLLKAQRSSEYRERSLIERGVCLMLAGRPDSALIDFARAIEQDKAGVKQETLHARYCMASCFETMRRIDKAIEQWEIICKKTICIPHVAAKLENIKTCGQTMRSKIILRVRPATLPRCVKDRAKRAVSAVRQLDAAKWGC